MARRPAAIGRTIPSSRQRLWRKQSRGRSGRTIAAAAPHHTAHVVGLCRPRAEFREDHAAACERARENQRGLPTSMAHRRRQAISRLPSWPSRKSSLTAASRAASFGTFHFTARGDTTWYGFAEQIIRHYADACGRAPLLEPITTSAFPAPARRPANSLLDCSRIESVFQVRRPPWRESLDACGQGSSGNARHSNGATVLGGVMKGISSGRRHRHAPVSGDPGDQQATAADLRQADDLLSAQHPDAGGHPRHPDHHHAARPTAVPAASGRRQPSGAST